MSDMAQYTEVRPSGLTPLTYRVHLKVGAQEFTLYPPFDDLEEAAFMREMLNAALERIVKERREDPTW